MDSGNNNKARRPLGDLTNNTGGENESTLCQSEDESTDGLHRNGSYVPNVISTSLTGCNPSLCVDYPDSRKKHNVRTRQAARRAQMSQEQKDETNRKQRKTRLQNKIQKINNQPSDKENNNLGCAKSIGVDDPESRKKEIARTRAAARRAQMSQEQKDEINRKQRERRLQNKIQKSNNQSSDKENINLGEPTLIDPKEVKRAKDRARIASQHEVMSQEQKELVSKKRREAYHAKTPSEKEARRDRQRVLNMTPAISASKRAHKRALNEFRANNLHPASIAKPSPHWTPELIFPESSSAKPISIDDMVIPDFSGTPAPIWLPPPADQGPIVETPEFRAARTIHRHRVTPGERTSLLTQQNEVFEKTIARNTIGVHNEDSDGTDDTPQSDAIDHGAVKEDAGKPQPMDRDAPAETRTCVVGHETSKECPPTNTETTNAEESDIEDDGDEGIIFEEDDEEGEGYLFAGQEEEDNVDVEFAPPEGDASEPEVEDPYDGVYANVPSETHMLEVVDSCKHCNAKKFESESPGFCCRGGKLHLPTPDTPP